MTKTSYANLWLGNDAQASLLQSRSPYTYEMLNLSLGKDVDPVRKQQRVVKAKYSIQLIALTAKAVRQGRVWLRYSLTNCDTQHS